MTFMQILKVRPMYSDALRNSYIEFVRKGAHIRFITEITKENLNYCEEIMNFVNFAILRELKELLE